MNKSFALYDEHRSLYMTTGMLYMYGVSNPLMSKMYDTFNIADTVRKSLVTKNNKREPRYVQDDLNDGRSPLNLIVVELSNPEVTTVIA